MQKILTEWRKYLTEAKKAKLTKQPLHTIVIFSSKYCGACKNLEKMLNFFDVTLEIKDFKEWAPRLRRILKAESTAIPIPLITIRPAGGKMKSKELMPAGAQVPWIPPYPPKKMPENTGNMPEIIPDVKKILCGAITGTFKKCSDAALAEYWPQLAKKAPGVAEDPVTKSPGKGEQAYRQRVFDRRAQQVRRLAPTMPTIRHKSKGPYRAAPMPTIKSKSGTQQ